MVFSLLISQIAWSIAQRWDPLISSCCIRCLFTSTVSHLSPIVNVDQFHRHYDASFNKQQRLKLYYFLLFRDENIWQSNRKYAYVCEQLPNDISHNCCIWTCCSSLCTRACVCAYMRTSSMGAVLCSDHITVNSLMIKVFIHTHTSTDKDRVKIVRVCLCVCHTCICHAIAAWTIVLIRTFNLIFFDESVK